jgi:fused signal recognition particle receptor
MATPFGFCGYVLDTPASILIIFIRRKGRSMSAWNTEVLAQTAETASQASTIPEWAILVAAALILLALAGLVMARKKKTLPADESTESSQTKASTPTALQEAAAPIELVPGAPRDVSEIRADDQASWLNRLKQGLSKTRNQLNLARLFGGRSAINDQLLEEVHETLYRSDMGVETADRLVGSLKRKFAGRADMPVWDEVAAALRDEVADVFQGNERPMAEPASGPLVILVVGVNGVGKTTSIGKLAARFVAEGKSVLLCAGDTFRAAAIEQLQVWGDRLNVPVIRQQQGSDPASVAFDGVRAAVARQVDILLVDTAGRLHSKTELMDELAKVKRVVNKELPGAPHETWLVIDATTGQNAVQQVKAFQEIIQLSGLVVTKLDGTAKGGVIIGIRNRFQLPIRYIGVGEKAADLKEFVAKDYAESIFS